MNPGEFKKLVKHRLVDLNMTQADLIREITKQTGLYLDSSYMSKIFNGKNHNQKILDSMKKILDLPEG